MQIIVYHIPDAFDRSYLPNDSKSILINSESLTKVALINTNCSEINQALEQAFALTQHGYEGTNEPWYDNPGVVCYVRTRSTSSGDILAAAGTWWMVASVGFWRHGERWQFESSPPQEPTPSDAVLGNPTINIPTGGVVLGGVEGVKRNFINAKTSEQHQEVVAQALKYDDAGMELIKTYGTQYCASVVSDNKGQYFAVILEATRIRGYQSLYWWVTNCNDPQSFEQATSTAIQQASLRNIPFFWEIGHLVKAEFGWVGGNSDYLNPMIDFWYAVNSSGKIIQFKQGIMVADEPDRIVKINHQIINQWRVESH